MFQRRLLWATWSSSKTSSVTLTSTHQRQTEGCTWTFETWWVLEVCPLIKLELFGHIMDDGVVWRRKGQFQQERNGIMNKEDYVDILKANVKTFSVSLALVTAGSSSKAVTWSKPPCWSKAFWKTNLDAVEQFAMEEWATIPPEIRQELVRNYYTRLLSDVRKVELLSEE